MKGNSKVSGPAVVAAIVATAGAALAITFLVRQKVSRRPNAILARCDEAIGELERRMLCGQAA